MVPFPEVFPQHSLSLASISRHFSTKNHSLFNLRELLQLLFSLDEELRSRDWREVIYPRLQGNLWLSWVKSKYSSYQDMALPTVPSVAAVNFYQYSEHEITDFEMRISQYLSQTSTQGRSSLCSILRECIKRDMLKPREFRKQEMGVVEKHWICIIHSLILWVGSWVGTLLTLHGPTSWPGMITH